MTKKIFTRVALAGFLGACVSLAAAVAADEKAKELAKDAKCPLSGQACKAEHTADYLGKQVFFCCPNCPKAFKKDAKKFAAKAAHQLLLTKQIVQVGCPFSGGKLNDETAIEVAGTKVAFCCENCQAKAKKMEGDEQVAAIFANLKKGFTLQTKCPLSGKAINPAAMVKHKGEKVFFCCEGCPAAFKSDPEKYIAKLPQFETEKK